MNKRTLLGFLALMGAGQLHPAMAAPLTSDIRVTKTAPATANVGDNLTYTITVVNNGPDGADNVGISDNLPAGTTFVSATQTNGPTATIYKPTVGQNGTVTAFLPSLSGPPEVQRPQGKGPAKVSGPVRVASPIATFEVVVKLGSGAVGNLSNSVALVASDSFDPDGTNNGDIATTTVPLKLDVTLSDETPKTKDLLTVMASGGPAGTTYNYEWTVTHDGQSSIVQTTTDSQSATNTLNLALAGNGDKGDTISVEVIATYNGETSPAANDSATVVNSAPVFDPGDTLSFNEDTPQGITLDVSDDDGDALSVLLNSLPAHGKLYDGADANAPLIAFQGTQTSYALTATGTDKNKLFFVPDADFHGADSFDVQVSDDNTPSATDEGTISLLVLSSNDAPSFTKGANQSAANAAGAQTVTGWATDISAGPENEATQNLDFIVTALDPSLFTVQPAISSDGTLTYTPKSGASGSTRVEVSLHDDGGTAHDGVDTSAVQNFTITVTETSKPVPSISTPTAGQRLAVAAFNTVTGSATDNVGVTEVFIKVIRTREGVRAYFNGTEFSEVPTLLPVTLADPGAPSTTWSYEVPPALKNALDDGPYAVYAYAKDAAGNLSGAFTRNFTIYRDSTKPVPVITSPTKKQTLSITAFNNITGSATDNVGVTDVLLKLFRNNGGTLEYWNGTSFTTTSTLLPANLASSSNTKTTWSYAVSTQLKAALTPGSYLVYAYARDGAGNQSSAVSQNFFLTTDDTKPSVPVISTPTQGQSLDLNDFTSITGNAKDNLGVNQVLLRLYRTRDGVTKYWNGTAFTTTASTFLATVESPDAASTNWTYTVTPQLRNALDDGAYGIQAYGRDASGNQSAAASRTFKLSISLAPPAPATNAASDSSANDS